MSLKNKSKSLGHLTGVGGVSPQPMNPGDKRMVASPMDTQYINHRVPLHTRSGSAVAIKAVTPKVGINTIP